MHGIKIIGVSLPPVSYGAKKSKRWEMELFPHISAEQREYVESFHGGGDLVLLRCARILARMAAIANYRRSGHVAPFIFSYSEDSIFCAVTKDEKCRCAVDAEKPFSGKIRSSIAGYLKFLYSPDINLETLNAARLTRLWTLHECLMKLAGTDILPDIKKFFSSSALTSNYGSGKLRGKSIQWRWLCLPAHILCAVHYGETACQITWRWLHWHKLYKLYSTLIQRQSN